MLKENIFVCIASIPERRISLERTIHSLIHQTDKIYLYLNGYDKGTAEKIKSIHRNKIEYVIGDNRLGDAGKFYWANKLNGFIVTCDDDIIYPPDYIQKLIEGIERYGRKAIVSFHGKTLRIPMDSYYRGNYTAYPFFSYVGSDISVHIAGTGVAGWHNSAIDISYMNDFPSANMADIHFSILAQKKKVPIIALAHNTEWIKPAQEVSIGILEKMKFNDGEQTQRVNEVGDWKTYQVVWIKEASGGEISPTKAYIINLIHRADRYSNVFNECVHNNMIPVRIDAVDGKKEGLDANWLVASHYGCRASHIKALEIAYNDGQEYSLIIEDDCVFAEDFKSKLIEYVKQLPADWDLLYLGGSLINDSVYRGGSLINTGVVENFSINLHRARNVLTTHAYIVRRDSIPKLLNVIKSSMDKIDLLFCKFQQHNNCFIVYPELAWQRVGYSDIVSGITDNIHLRYGRK